MSETEKQAGSHWRGHPDYSDGYFDALHGRPFARTTEPYFAGREAGKRAVALFESNGFTRKGGHFEKSFALSTPSKEVGR